MDSHSTTRACRSVCMEALHLFMIQEAHQRFIVCTPTSVAETHNRNSSNASRPRGSVLMCPTNRSPDVGTFNLRANLFELKFLKDVVLFDYVISINLYVPTTEVELHR